MCKQLTQQESRNPGRRVETGMAQRDSSGPGEEDLSEDLTLDLSLTCKCVFLPWTGGGQGGELRANRQG